MYASNEHEHEHERNFIGEFKGKASNKIIIEWNKRFQVNNNKVHLESSSSSS